MRHRRSQVALTLVALALGLLVVLQIRAQNGGAELANRSAQELTVIVANLNTRNDQLRTEIATLEKEAGDLQSAQSRGQTSVDQLRDDLARIQAWTGLLPVEGRGVRVRIDGPIHSGAIDDVLNELRNAGAEAITVDGVRVVTGIVVAGAPGELSVENHAIGDGFEIRAIGSPQILTGTLTRTGGVIAQVGNAYADARLTVTPLDSMTLPASDRTQAPVYAKPRL